MNRKWAALACLFLFTFYFNIDAKNFATQKQCYVQEYDKLIQSYFYGEQKNNASQKQPSKRAWSWLGYFYTLNTTGRRNEQKTFSWAELCSKTRNAVVQFFTYCNEYNLIEPYKAPDRSSCRGSGFIISDDGYILTNFHVVENGVKVVVQLPSLGKKKFDLDFIGALPELDVALWKFTDQALEEIKHGLGVEKLDYLDFGNSDELNDAEEVMSLGFPLGQENFKSSIGYISGRERIQIGYAANEYLQTTTPSNPGNSGGPYLNKYGQVIGIVVGGTHNADGINWIIPINNVIAALKELTNKAIIRNPWWGFNAIKTTPTMLNYLGSPTDGGMYVIEIEEGSLFDKAGICKGDVLYTIFDKQIDYDGYVSVSWTKDKVYLLDILTKIPFGQNITIGIYRDGEKKEVSFTSTGREKRGIDYFFPWYEPSLDYEIIAGMIIVPLTRNFLDIAQRCLDPEMFAFFAPYEKIEHQNDQRLCITTTFPQSLADLTKCFARSNGDRIISEVNGIPVRTIEDFRKAVLLSKGKTHLTLKTEGEALVAFAIDEIIEQEELFCQIYQYEKSQLIDALKS